MAGYTARGALGVWGCARGAAGGRPIQPFTRPRHAWPLTPPATDPPIPPPTHTDHPRKPPQDAGGQPYDLAAVTAAGGQAGGNPLYGTRYAFLPRGSDGLFRLLSQADAIIDESYYAVGVPSLANVSRSLGYNGEKDAAAGVPAFKAGAIYRWARSGGGGAPWRRGALRRRAFAAQAGDEPPPRKTRMKARSPLPSSPPALPQPLSWDGELSPTGSSGWLEMAVARPDWVLMDLARALTPQVLVRGAGARQRAGWACWAGVLAGRRGGLQARGLGYSTGRAGGPAAFAWREGVDSTSPALAPRPPPQVDPLNITNHLANKGPAGTVRDRRPQLLLWRARRPAGSEGVLECAALAAFAPLSLQSHPSKAAPPKPPLQSHPSKAAPSKHPSKTPLQTIPPKHPQTTPPKTPLQANPPTPNPPP